MSLCKDLVFLILQFCDEENLKRTAHMLEQETGYFFDLEYFEELVLHGNWEETEKYLSSFTVVEDNNYSTKIYFEIRKQKFLEALDKHEFSAALGILLKDLKVFGQLNNELYKEMAQLLTLDDFREHNSLTLYGDTLSARKRVINDIRTVIEANPLLQGRTRIPQINKSRLRRLINQSLNWQHIHCVHPHPQPHIDTLFTDHKCPGPDDMPDQLNKESSLPTTPKALSALPLMGDSSSNQSVTESNLSTQDAAPRDSKNCHDDSKLNSSKTLDDEVASTAACSSSCRDSAKEPPSEFPRTVERILDMGSSATTMDFHPLHETLLLVGKSVGDIELWDVTSAEKLFKSEFMSSEEQSVSGVLLEGKGKNHCISVNRVLWAPDSFLFGVAYSERVIRLYSYQRSGNYIQKQLEIDAHVGSVNDLAFSKPHDKFVVISCGDDELIQVWDAVTGSKQYTFEGHGSPVYSVCPHMKDDVHFLFSISTSGEIKAWLFDDMGSRVTYDAPGFCCMRMAYSADGKRLFSCGTNKNGESYIVEWNDSDGSIIKKYRGLNKCSSAMIHFDTSINRFLAVGDDHLIKIWDMDKAEILAVIDADLPVRPYICFSKKGNLLAVSADDNQIKILANDHGCELLQTSTYVSDDSSEYLTESLRKLSVHPMPVPLEPAVVERGVASEEALYMLENLKLKGTADFTRMEMPHFSKVVEVPRCQSVLLTSEVKTNVGTISRHQRGKFQLDGYRIYIGLGIRRLLYTHAGNGILALAEDGTHLFWKWVKNDANKNGEASTKWSPQLWKPKGGLLMINDLSENGLDLVTPCLALTKNDSYVISASGRMVTVYNLLTFKVLKRDMRPPPTATCIVFYPADNNVLAIGRDDSIILIYNIREDQLISKLQGHSKGVTALAFSTTLGVLVSCGVDTQIVLWDIVTWEKKKSTILQISVGWVASELSETNIVLDKDHTHFLAVHETQLAIYETITLRLVKQWTIANFCTRISHATYSCDSQSVYAVMRDGILLILDASDLTPRFEIGPSAYLPPRLSSYVDPVVVAAHPKKPYQFAVGLSNGEVVVIEPFVVSEGKWTVLSPSL